MFKHIESERYEGYANRTGAAEFCCGGCTADLVGDPHGQCPYCGRTDAVAVSVAA